MPKIRSAPSKRMSSRQHHKIERKKREHKRDLRKAAKELRKKGLGPKRSKKSRELAKLALKLSNAHPDKELILTHVLQASENARVVKSGQLNAKEMGKSSSTVLDRSPSPRNHRRLLFIPVSQSNNFKYQFLTALSNLIFPSTENEEAESSFFELPSAAYVITLDSRFAVQATPWSLLDAIVDAANAYKGGRRVLLIFTLTKVDLVSTSAVVSQVCLLASALRERYPQGLGENLVATVAPFSIYHEQTGRHLLRILHQFRQGKGCSSQKIKSNLDNKICAFVVGLPSTGRRSLCRHLASAANETGVSTVPLKAAQLQLIKVNTDDDATATVRVKFAFPNAKAVTLIQLPEDARMRKELQNITGGDVFFRSEAFVDSIPEPEAIACVLFEGFLDKTSLAQAFCQALPGPLFAEKTEEPESFRAAQRFLRDLGRTVRREKGFHVSPLFVSGTGSMGRLSSSLLTASATFTSGGSRNQNTLLDATYSNAAPSKLIRISSVCAPLRGTRKRNSHVRRTDVHNAFRLGARTFIRELWQGKHVPWAVMRAPGKQAVGLEQVSKALEWFNEALCRAKKVETMEERKGEARINAFMDALSMGLKDVLIFMPNRVVEMDPDCVVPPQYDLNECAFEPETAVDSDFMGEDADSDNDGDSPTEQSDEGE